MRIGVAVDAARGSQFVSGLFARWFVTLDAINLGVLPSKSKFAVLVLFASEQRWFEAGLGMACRTVASRRAPGKLPAVHIVMAIATAFVRHRLPEVGILVTLETIEFGVLAFQRELGLLMIEP